MTIKSVQNEYIKSLAKLNQKKYRDQTKTFIVEGEHLVNEAKAAGLIKQIIIRENSKFHLDDAIFVSDEVMNKISSNVSLNDIVALCNYQNFSLNLRSKVVILDEIQDPGNIGTIIRTALAFGFKDIILSKNSVDIYNEKLIKASQGAIFKVNIVVTDIIDIIKSLQADNYKVYGTAIVKALNLGQFKQTDKLALIFGNEGKGIKPEVLELTDANIYIPIQEFDSLNVAVAAGICLNHFSVIDTNIHHENTKVKQ